MSTVCVIASSQPRAFACLSAKNQIWNWGTTVWDAIPASGTPLPAHLQLLANVTTGTGSLAQQLIGSIPDSVANVSGAYIAVFSCSPAGVLSGTPADLIDCIPMMTSPPPLSWVIGGIAR